jgi:hypothetical protein
VIAGTVGNSPLVFPSLKRRTCFRASLWQKSHSRTLSSPGSGMNQAVSSIGFASLHQAHSIVPFDSGTTCIDKKNSSIS